MRTRRTIGGLITVAVLAAIIGILTPATAGAITDDPVLPGAPTGVTATAGSTRATINFAPPAFTGGVPITGYTVTASPPDVSPVNGAVSPIVVTGLTNGTTYTFTVTADNAAGTGPASAPSNSVTPAPTITGVTASTADGIYGAGATIDVQVLFDENVAVDTTDGTPRLELETGSTDRFATYTSGSGTNTLTFQYVVQPGDQTADLGYTSKFALELHGGIVREASGSVPADLTLPVPGAAGSLEANKDIVVDGVAPVVTQSSPAPTAEPQDTVVVFTVDFSETIEPPVASNFSLTATGTASGSIADVSGAGHQYNVEIRDISGSGTLRVDVPFVSNIRDTAGNLLAAGFTAGTAHEVTATPSPRVIGVTSRTPNGTYRAGVVIDVQVVFDQVVEVIAGGEDIPRLELETGSTDRFATYTSGSGSNMLTFHYLVLPGDQTADLDYTSEFALELHGGIIRDESGSVPADLTLPVPGAAGSLEANKDIVIDAVDPTVTGVTSPDPNGRYKADATIRVDVSFSEPVLVTGTPRLELNVLETSRLASYMSGSGSTTLTFSYTVQAGDQTADLDYTSTSAVTLDGGTIRDFAGNDARLTLPGPGATGSLSANKDIVIDGVAPAVTQSAPAPTAGPQDTVVVFTVDFSETIEPPVASDFSLTTTGTASGSIADVSGAGQQYTVEVRNISGSGTLRVDVPFPSDITDTAGNPLAAGFTAGTAHTVVPGIPPVGPTPEPPAPPSVERASGTNRYSTSAALSELAFTGPVPVVYLAVGTTFADALTGGTAAAHGNGPVLLVETDTIPSVIAEELTRLQPARIVILGGTDAISETVFGQAGRYTDGPVIRLAGIDRFGTAAALSAATFDPGADVVYVATGRGFADSLAAATLGGPLLLVDRDTIPAVTAAELARLQGKRIVVLGGPAAVSDAVVAALGEFTDGTVTRLAGIDRYATSAAMSSAFEPGVPVLYLASGADFADGLSAGPVAAFTDGPLLLTQPTCIPQVVLDEIERLRPERIVLVGGSAALGAPVADLLPCG